MKFTIIIPYYQGSTTEWEFFNCLKSLKEQTCKDFEALIYHDGKLKHKLSMETRQLIKEIGAKFTITKKHYHDWGHSLRDKGIKDAKGEYIIHLNADNILYDVLGDIKKITVAHKIIILPLRMNGICKVDRGDGLVDVFPFPFGHMYYRGIPKHRSIDCMQLVMRTDLWRKYGGWYDKRMDGDGYMYERFCKENKYLQIENIAIGEHN